VAAPEFGSLPGPLRALVAEELNVHEVAALDSGAVDTGSGSGAADLGTGPGSGSGSGAADLGRGPGALVRYTVKPQFRSLGRRFGASTQAVAAAIRDMDTAVFARAFAGDRDASGQSASVSVEVPSLGTVSVGPDDVVVTQTPLEGWGVATAGGETVALDLSLTADLRAEGRAREAIRLIQDARKNAGLDVTDRILLRWSADEPGLATALTAHAVLVAGEVLATGFDEGAPREDGTRTDGTREDTGGEDTGGAWHAHRDDDLGLSFWFARDPR
jgi:hypothetical protein